MDAFYWWVKTLGLMACFLAIPVKWAGDVLLQSVKLPCNVAKAINYTYYQSSRNQSKRFFSLAHISPISEAEAYTSFSYTNSWRGWLLHCITLFETSNIVKKASALMNFKQRMPRMHFVICVWCKCMSGSTQCSCVHSVLCAFPWWCSRCG